MTADPQLAPAGNGIIDLTPDPETLEPKRFRVGPADDDVFTACASVPVLLGVEAIRLLTNEAGDDTSAAERTVAFLEKVIYPEDLERFQARLTDLRRPIDHRLLFKILDELLVRWGYRPTRPSGSSSDGQPDRDDGTSSTDAPPSSGSTSPDSPSTGS